MPAAENEPALTPSHPQQRRHAHRCMPAAPSCALTAASKFATAPARCGTPAPLVGPRTSRRRARGTPSAAAASARTTCLALGPGAAGARPRGNRCAAWRRQAALAFRRRYETSVKAEKPAASGAAAAAAALRQRLDFGVRARYTRDIDRSPGGLRPSWLADTLLEATQYTYTFTSILQGRNVRDGVLRTKVHSLVCGAGDGADGEQEDREPPGRARRRRARGRRGLSPPGRRGRSASWRPRAAPSPPPARPAPPSPRRRAATAARAAAAPPWT